MTKEKVFKVIAISDQRTLAINAGKIDGVTQNSKFDIMERKSMELIDPDTAEVFDTIFPKKQRVYVSEVLEKYCICVSEYTSITGSTATVASTAFAAAMLGSSRPASNHTKKRRIGTPMHVDAKEVSHVFSYTHGVVHIGDVATLVVGNA